MTGICETLPRHGGLDCGHGARRSDEPRGRYTFAEQVGAFLAWEGRSSRRRQVIGSDTWASEAVPGEDVDRPFDCHVEWMVHNGVFNLENLDLSQLIEDGAYEFYFVWSPLKMKGATGSPGKPMALY